MAARTRKRVRHNSRIGDSFERLVALQARLRGRQGCPWDREQTHQSLRPFLLEEVYEVLDALESEDSEKFASELGDLLLQVVFHAELAREEGKFDIHDVTQAIQAKLVRRHPYVFGKVRARTASEVLKNWEQVKAEERGADGEAKRNKNSARSLLDGVSQILPALLEAHQLTRRAANIGFDWENFEGLIEKLQEETRELRQALARGQNSQASAPSREVEEEVGDLLFVAANVARFLGVDPELALKKANRKFVARFRNMEKELAHKGRQLAQASREEMETLWERSKSKA